MCHIFYMNKVKFINFLLISYEVFQFLLLPGGKLPGCSHIIQECWVFIWVWLKIHPRQNFYCKHYLQYKNHKEPHSCSETISKLAIGKKATEKNETGHKKHYKILCLNMIYFLVFWFGFYSP